MPHKSTSNAEENMIEIKVDMSDMVRKEKVKKLSGREKRLIKYRKELRRLRYEWDKLNIDSTVVHGYCRDVLNDQSDNVPLEILKLMIQFVGDHFSKGKMEESAQGIIQLVTSTTDPMIEDYKRWRPDSDPFPLPPLTWFILLFCICCPCLVVGVILLFIAYIITFGFCCHGNGLYWMRDTFYFRIAPKCCN